VLLEEVAPGSLSAGPGGSPSFDSELISRVLFGLILNFSGALSCWVSLFNHLSRVWNVKWTLFRFES